MLRKYSNTPKAGTKLVANREEKEVPSQEQKADDDSKE